MTLNSLGAQGHLDMDSGGTGNQTRNCFPSLTHCKGWTGQGNKNNALVSLTVELVLFYSNTRIFMSWGKKPQVLAQKINVGGITLFKRVVSVIQH